MIRNLFDITIYCFLFPFKAIKIIFTCLVKKNHTGHITIEEHMKQIENK